jgi:hypothetical protein
MTKMAPQYRKPFLLLHGWTGLGQRWWRPAIHNSYPRPIDEAVAVQRSANSAKVMQRCGWAVVGDYRNGFRVHYPDSQRLYQPGQALAKARRAGVLIWEEQLEVPTVALPGRGGRLSCWCRFCDRWHHHGRPDGHRIAHCDAVTPYTKTGYIIQRGWDQPVQPAVQPLLH